MAQAGKDPFRLECRELAPGIWQIRLEGTVDASNVAQLRASLDASFQKGIYKLVVDLNGVKFISSPGYACLLASVDTARARGGDLVFLGAPRDVVAIFELLGLSTILHCAGDMTSALARLKG